MNAEDIIEYIVEEIDCYDSDDLKINNNTEQLKQMENEINFIKFESFDSTTPGSENDNSLANNLLEIIKANYSNYDRKNIKPDVFTALVKDAIKELSKLRMYSTLEIVVECCLYYRANVPIMLEKYIIDDELKQYILAEINKIKRGV